MQYNTQLTSKQEKFARLMVQGLNQSEAYKEAYNPEHSLDTTISRDAYTIANNPKIITRIAELRASVTGPVIADAVEVQSFWSETMRDRTESIKARLDASELLGKSQRLFVQQVESTSTEGFARLVEALKDTTTDELRNKVNALRNSTALPENTTLDSEQLNPNNGDSGNTLDINNRTGE